MTFGADMLIFFTSPDDTPFGTDVADFSSLGYKEPSHDFEQNVIFPDDWKEKLDDGRYRLTVRRALDTGDIFEDYVIPVDEDFFIGFAYNTYYNALSSFMPHNFENRTLL